MATTVTAGAKTELASSLGAELCIDYRRENVGEKLRAWTEMDGADVVHDTVGGKTFTDCFSLVRPYGDLVSNVESEWEDEAITAMQNRNLRVSFTWMPAPSVFGWPDQRERQRAILEQAARHFDAGDLRVAVGDVPSGQSRRRASGPRSRRGRRESRSYDGVTGVRYRAPLPNTLLAAAAAPPRASTC